MLGKHFLLCALFFIANPQVVAKEAKTNTAIEFMQTANYQLLICGIKAKTAFLEVELGKETSSHSIIGACQKEGRSEVKNLYPKANAQFAKKPAASKALKDFYVAWLAALDGISPSISERKIDYERRQGDASRKADEAWSRFEIEAEF